MTLPVQNRDLSLDRQGAAEATTYLITFVCYGAWLPGQTGAVPMTQNAYGAPLPEADDDKEQRARNGMSQQPTSWMRRAGNNRRRWARHGSTRYLWTSAAVSAAIHYVVREQGDAMAVFEMPAAR